MPTAEDGESVSQENSSALANQPLVGKWWESKLMITVVTLILGAVAPVTTAVKEHFRIKKEAERAQQNQEQQIQMQYLTLVLRSDLSLPNRELVLRFLEKTAVKQETKEWAKNEIKLTEQQKAKDAQELAKKEQQARSTASARAKNSPQQEEALRELKADIERLRRRLDDAAVKPSQSFTGERYRCVHGTVRAVAGPGALETHNSQCTSSLASDGTPPTGIFGGLGAFTYSWSIGGVSCDCLVTLSLGS